eukprot:TRINITY_DN10490_c0_g1_i1.p2 TRINITY_DN10490_c0_g1~~TRINITY_DN10490_c0_g1_i1.p2  ORF type:complete len:142 (+),score=13.20 TRINITY_DN10490_c0_g1_i1:423-848(+)
MAPELATATPLRRHSGKSMWSTPALVVTTQPRQGRLSNSSALTGASPEHKIALTDNAWPAKNWSLGSGDSHGLRRRYLFERRSSRKKFKGRSRRTKGLSSSFSFLFTFPIPCIATAAIDDEMEFATVSICAHGSPVTTQMA